MTRIFSLCLIFCLPWSALHAQDPGRETGNTVVKDTGKEKIGSIRSTLYIGTNDEIAKLGEKTQNAASLNAATIKKLRGIEKMRFKHYRQLGVDTQAVFRSYENWLSPLKPSEEILLSFESRGRSSDGGLRLDLEFWQQHRKVMKSDPVLHKGRPLLILGPKWRGGTLIIAVELIEYTSK